MKWYYIDESVTDGERRKGPYNIDEIRDFVKDSVIKEETLVWHSGMDAWVAWKQVEESKTSGKIEALSEEEQIKKALETILAVHNNGKRYAGFFVRGIAYFIDNFILSVLGIALLMLLGYAHLVDFSALTNAMNAFIDNPQAEDALSNVLNAPGMHVFLTIWGIAQAAYFVAFTTIKAATPGKMLLHLHIETAGGQRLNWVTSSLRYVASLFTQCTFAFYGLGYIIVMIDPKRRALHDHLARTRVVYNKKA